MKKSLLALAVLGAYAGVASAQSSVTLYGTLDVNGRYVKNDGSSSRYSLATDGINSSQLGFRGIEDLGGGLKAGFLLLAGVNPDAGTANGKFWNRRSTVSLFSNAGELRLGRDYKPDFWNTTIFDAFGTNGLGASNNARFLYPGVRSDNSVGYFLPSNIGGFYGQFMIAPGEAGASPTNTGSGSDQKGGKYYGGRLGFAAGPFDVAIAYGWQKYVQATTVGAVGPVNPGAPLIAVPGDTTQKTWNVGGTYDFGFFKLLGYYNRENVSANDRHEDMISISGVIPLGQGEIHLGYDWAKLHNNAVLPGNASNTTFTADNIKATYQYNLSKRTALYGTVARLDNHDNTQITIGGPASNAGGGSVTALPTLGGKSKGFEVGVRHFF